MRYLAPVFSVRMFKDSQCCESEPCWYLICWFNDETGRRFKRSCFRWAAAATDIFTWSVCKRSQRTDVFHLQWQSFGILSSPVFSFVQSRHPDTSRSHYMTECEREVAPAADLWTHFQMFCGDKTVSLSQQVGSSPAVILATKTDI